MVMSKYLIVNWSETQQAQDFDYLLQLFGANRDSCELVHEAKWSMLVRYENGCLDEVTSNQKLDAWQYENLQELLEEQEVESLEELKADLDHTDELLDASNNADDDDEFKKNLANIY